MLDASAPTAWWCTTRTPEVVEARAGVFEFLLVNHPLDCPVCDKGGECPLQDFSYTFGPDQSRMEFPRRVFDGEGVKADVDFGPTLMLNRNRCILCTRCVRFMRDIDGDAQINIIDRGYGSEIATFQEEGVHSLLSGNLMDVCPVGAITTRDYRFKSRPWDNPNAVDTICTLCSKGCNTTAWIKAKPEWAKGSRLIRFTPRFNPDVNGYWMCDIGRFDYHWIEGDDRAAQAADARRAAALQQPVSWHDATAKLRDRLAAAGTAEPGRRPVPAVGARVARRAVPVPAARRGAARRRRAAGDRASAGAISDEAAAGATRSSRCRRSTRRTSTARAMFGLAPGAVGDERARPDIVGAARGGRGGQRVGAVRVRSGPGRLDRRHRVDRRRAHARHAAAADRAGRAADRRWRAPPISCCPAHRYVEKEASYTNDQGRLQGTSRAIPPPGEAMEDWQILVNLGAALGVPFDYTSAGARPRRHRRAVRRRSPGCDGLDDARRSARPCRRAHWLQASNPSERWKWDFMFQDLPPVKGGSVEPLSLPTSAPDPVEAGEMSRTVALGRLRLVVAGARAARAWRRVAQAQAAGQGRAWPRRRNATRRAGGELRTSRCASSLPEGLAHQLEQAARSVADSQPC